MSKSSSTPRLASTVPLTLPSFPPLAAYRAMLPPLWASGSVTNGGPYVHELERRIARYLPARNVVAVGNGTLALQLALRAVGGARGVVVTTPFTFAATTTALVWQGFTPRFADIDRETFVLDTELAADALGRDAVGILPVQVFGNPAGSRELVALARERSRWIVFDSAHSFGVRTDGGSIFHLGDASALSLHATKSFHTFEGGAVVTPNRSIARRVSRMRNFGFEPSGDIEEPGINAKLTEPHAAIGLLNLGYLDEWIRARAERARLYRDLLASLRSVEVPRVTSARHNHIYFPILLPDRRRRDRVFRRLGERGIRTRRYFFPLTSDFSFMPRALRRRYPIASEIANRILCLPLYHELPLREVRRVVREVRETLA